MPLRKLNIALWALIVWTPYLTYGQQNSNQLIIQEVRLHDSLLIKELQHFLDSLEIYDQYWKTGKGYLSIYIKALNLDEMKKGIKTKYIINAEISELDDTKNDLPYPLFYSKISGRIALIKSDYYMSSLIRYSIKKSSKKKLSKLLSPFLFKRKKIVLRDTEGNIIGKDKDFRTNYIDYHGAGLEVIIFHNDSISVSRIKHY